MTKILIVKLSSLGDIVHTLPMVLNLKKAYPESEIHWLVTRSFANILKNVRQIDKTHFFERDRWRGMKNTISNLSEICALLKTLKQENYDIVIDYQGLFRSGLATFATRAPRRIGFQNAREFAYLAYNERVLPKSIHAIDKNAELTTKVTNQPCIIQFPEIINLKNKAKSLKITDNKNYIALLPGARWDSKRWPIENFLALTQLLPNENFLLLGSKSEQPLEEYFSAQQNTTSLIGKTSLSELAAILQQTKIAICNDSGPMHLAVAVNTPVIALFGPTDSKKTGPYGDQNFVLQANVPCHPCRNKVCKKKDWCMKKITPQQVVDIIHDLQK
ncbi:MAG TPA: lipopolysaccharide heptosyltransferase I [Planctomycetota bacterium]|nr:lipopolysaccharide heptosyltransferase I [Planctomycetota bacterium]HPY75124.1 lipopolysaccharide heptosyltransferase I [Planctomycetota bacterium]HQB00692.1 lipopolysaccharide heptosyltransferase I [Planctomycetota bacterium]